MQLPDDTRRKAARSVTSLLKAAMVRPVGQPSVRAPTTVGLRPVVQPSLPAAPVRQSAYRADVGGAQAAGDVLTKLAVVVLSSINAVMWGIYTQAPLMAALWAAIAIGFVGWMVREVRRR